ncbi:MAG: hypothetical protein IKS48_11485 [Eubacterium sp.]|nr:hypothetical protein [Clostridiales bacterium]MBR6403996.1 hypothetical protein [Eubacterium sp.]
MGAGYHGGFGNTEGSLKLNLQLFANRAIEPNGHVTEQSLSDHREYFWGKSVKKIEKILQKHGYQTKRRPSIHSDSKAKIIVTTNHSKDKNITQIQVSPGSKRHGHIPYVKVSTNDSGKFKLVNGFPHQYKTDNKEKAKIFFRRR